jgi:hypothetical protein
MIRIALFVLAVSAVSVKAQTAPTPEQLDCTGDRSNSPECVNQLAEAAAAAEDVGVTGFVPLVAPAIGAAAAALGLTAAAGGGSTPSTTSTVSTN